MNNIIKKLGSFFLAFGIMAVNVSSVYALDGRSSRFNYSDATGDTSNSWSIYSDNTCVADHYTIWLNQWWCNTLSSSIQFRKASSVNYKYLEFRAAVSAGGPEYNFSDWKSNDITSPYDLAEAYVNISNSVSGTGVTIAYWQ